MKRIIGYLVLFVGLVSCNSNKMGLSIRKLANDNVELKIENFPEFTKMNGELTEPSNDYTIDQINKEIFNYLMSNTENEDSCFVKYNMHFENQYGKMEISPWQELGKIDLNELRKYVDYKLWQESTCGIVFVKYGERYGFCQ